MLPHSIHDTERRTLPFHARRLGGYSQRIYQSLRVLLPDIGKKVIDVSSNVGVRGLNSCNNLEVGSKFAFPAIRLKGYLGNDWKPSIDFDGGKSTRHSMTDSVMRAKFEP